MTVELDGPAPGRAEDVTASRPAPASAARWPDEQISEMRVALLTWFDASARHLPFRGESDPWAILVSEVMAQQTQAERAGEAWRRFMDRFPSPEALAAAELADVLRAWRGLGYNRRALSLQRAADRVAREHSGIVPEDPAVLQTLPGVGPYTARAVAALAHGRRVGAVDTNVRRVVQRLVGERLAPKPLQAAADQLVDPARPGDWNHALMDVGAGPCRPVDPRCGLCPLQTWCRTAVGAPASPAPGSTAARTRSTAARTRSSVPFPATARWLRGRIVDRLRDADRSRWVAIRGPLGLHDADAVARAADALVRDGLAERHPTDPSRFRLPIGVARAPGARTDAAARTLGGR